MVTWVRSLLGLVAGERDARLAAAIVDDPPEGLTVDQEMRWSVATAWSSLGLEGAAERVAAERRRDRSDRGERAELTASVARPDLAVKEETWERLHGSGYPSLHLAMAAARGFWRRSQREMLDPFVPRFFEGLPDVFDRWEFEAARAYWGNLFPRHRVDEDVQARVRSLLERDDLTAPLRRLLREADDDLGRALRCRAFAEAGLLPVPG